MIINCFVSDPYGIAFCCSNFGYKPLNPIRGYITILSKRHDFLNGPTNDQRHAEGVRNNKPFLAAHTPAPFRMAGILPILAIRGARNRTVAGSKRIETCRDPEGFTDL